MSASRSQTGLRALGNQRALELGGGAEYLQREHALGRAGGDRVAQAAEVGPSRLELLDYSKQMADRAGQSVKPDHDQGLARSDLPKQPGQHRPTAVRAGRMLFQHGPAARRAKLI